MAVVSALVCWVVWAWCGGVGCAVGARVLLLRGGGALGGLAWCLVVFNGMVGNASVRE